MTLPPMEIAPPPWLNQVANSSLFDVKSEIEQKFSQKISSEIGADYVLSAIESVEHAAMADYSEMGKLQFWPNKMYMSRRGRRPKHLLTIIFGP